MKIKTIKALSNNNFLALAVVVLYIKTKNREKL